MFQRNHGESRVSIACHIQVLLSCRNSSDRLLQSRLNTVSGLKHVCVFWFFFVFCFFFFVFCFLFFFCSFFLFFFFFFCPYLFS